MTRQEYIRRTLEALCGETPAHPDVYHHVVRMADSAATVYDFDNEQ